MWRPPERIRWQPDPGLWPSAAEAANSHLFSPIEVGPLTLAERTWVPAMVPWRATDDGLVTPEVLGWYERFAQGRPGAIVLTELVETVHQASGGETRLFIQLIDFLTIRRRPEADKYFQRFLTITDQHRAAIGGEDWSEEAVRDHLAALDDEEMAAEPCEP